MVELRRRPGAQAGFSQYLKSSLIITGSVVALSTILAIISGYAFGVLGVVGQKLLFPLVLLGIMLPMETFIVPLYYDFQSYGITDTYQGIVLAHVGMGVSFGAFWMRTAFRAVPRSIAESASHGRRELLDPTVADLPAVGPTAVVTLVLLSFTWTWNDYFLALILVSDPAHQPLTLGLGAFSGRYLVQVNMLSAAAVLISASDRGALSRSSSGTSSGASFPERSRSSPAGIDFWRGRGAGHGQRQDRGTGGDPVLRRRPRPGSADGTLHAPDSGRVATC